jgi:hypothetical protein
MHWLQRSSKWIAQKQFIISFSPSWSICLSHGIYWLDILLLSTIFIACNTYCLQYLLPTIFIAYNFYCRQYLLPTIFDAFVFQLFEFIIVQSPYCLEVSLSVLHKFTLLPWFNWIKEICYNFCFNWIISGLIDCVYGIWSNYASFFDLAKLILLYINCFFKHHHLHLILYLIFS